MLNVVPDGGGADGELIGDVAGGMAQGEQVDDALFLIGEGRGVEGRGGGRVQKGLGEVLGGELEAHLAGGVAKEMEAEEVVAIADGEGGDVEPEVVSGGGAGFEVEGGDGVAGDGLEEDGAIEGAEAGAIGEDTGEEFGAGGALKLGSGPAEELFGGGVGIGNEARGGDGEGRVGGGVEAIAEILRMHFSKRESNRAASGLA